MMQRIQSMFGRLVGIASLEAERQAQAHAILVDAKRRFGMFEKPAYLRRNLQVTSGRRKALPSSTAGIRRTAAGYLAKFESRLWPTMSQGEKLNGSRQSLADWTLKSPQSSLRMHIDT